MMKSFGRIICLLLFFSFQAFVINVFAQSSVYGFSVEDTEGNPVSMRTYKGKVLLIVNTATQCGFTPQYTVLEAMYAKYADQGFVVLDFPCNQFGSQAPGTMDEINAFCEAHFQTTFPRFNKIDVNGPKAHPLYTWLKKKQGFQGFGQGPLAQRLENKLRQEDKLYDKKPDIKWNFTKFLVDYRGRVVARFEPTVAMEDVERAVVEQIARCKR